jgi:hypothetical protein
VAALPLKLAAVPFVIFCVEWAVDFLPGTVLPPVFDGSADEDAPTVRFCRVV